MTARNIAVLAITAIAMFFLFGCSDDSLVSPTTTINSAAAISQAQPAPGSYVCDISFQFPINQDVSSLPVGGFMIFHAYVTDSSGSPATSGFVTFEECKFQGKNTSSDTCLNGNGQWRKVHGFGRGVDVISDGDRVGNAYAEGQTSTVPATRGYRCKFSLNGGPDGVGASQDFSWF